MENQKRTPFSGLASACSAVWDKTWPWMKLDGRGATAFLPSVFLAFPVSLATDLGGGLLSG